MQPFEETNDSITKPGEGNLIEYSVEEVLEKRTTSSEMVITETKTVTEPMLTESVLSNIASRAVQLQETQTTVERDSGENLNLIPEVLDISTANEKSMDDAGVNDDISGDLRIAAEVFQMLTKGEIDLETACSNNVFERISEKLDQSRMECSKSKTAKLWLLYLDMVCILKQFIKAERVGYRDLHLHSMSKMLPFFAASGHYLHMQRVYSYIYKICQSCQHLIQMCIYYFRKGIMSLGEVIDIGLDCLQT